MQATTEQIMIAQLIGGSSSSSTEDHQKKIGQVMDITGKEEDEVATALFDAGWDTSRAIEMLLEGGGGGAWEETGKKKKKKQNNDENKVILALKIDLRTHTYQDLT